MQKRPLGSTSLHVSAIGFGGMHLSIRERPTQEVAIRVIHASLDAGVTLIDTADVYCLGEDELGHNERLVARALKTWSGDRDSIIVATKGGMTRPDDRWERDARPEHLREACDSSLKALDVEYIDLYQLHAPDPNVPFADSVGALADLKKEGKIRWAGLSNVSVAEIAEAEAIVDVITVQNRLNPFFREALEDGVVACCAERGIGFLAYSPVGGGRLNKKLPDHPTLKPIARRYGASEHAIVLGWVLAQSPNVIAIPASRTEQHAKDAAGAAELQLSDEDLKAIDAAQFSRQ